MIHQTGSESPQPVAEEKDLVGIATHDLLAVGDGCPYARGTDTLKMHHLWMNREQALAMDKEIEARRSPACGKPIHPGSCMCRDHMRFARGYTQLPIPYPMAGAVFTCQHYPDSYDSEKRWISHDKNGNFCAEWDTDDEAKRTVDRWIAGGAEKVTLEWKASAKDSEDSDRGTYYIGLEGTSARIVVRCGWHSMEAAARKSAELRELLLEHGHAAAVAFISSANETSPSAPK
jgi:hypothetical protein